MLDEREDPDAVPYRREVTQLSSEFPRAFG
jgi:hypothetical protein